MSGVCCPTCGCDAYFGPAEIVWPDGVSTWYVTCKRCGTNYGVETVGEKVATP